MSDTSNPAAPAPAPAASSVPAADSAVAVPDMSTPKPSAGAEDADEPSHPVDLNAGGEDGKGTITLRALISTKEAGIIIGKAGETVAKLRDSTKVKAGVSKVVSGVQDRVLSITGSVDQISEAYGQVANLLLSTPLADPTHLPSNGFCSLRLLISHNLMGTIIGRQGQKIKQIQDASGARMVASKEMLPQSTERVVEVQGNVEAIKHALREIATCVLEDWERAQGTVPYHPGAAGDQGVLAGGLGAQTVTGPTGGIRRTSLAVGPFGLGDRRQSRAAPMPGGDRRQSETAALALANGMAGLNVNSFAAAGNGANPAATPFAPGYSAAPQQQQQSLSAASAHFSVDPLSPAATATTFGAPASAISAPAQLGGGGGGANLKTQNISIPSDMVGCIIGRAGSKITEIRRLSGSRISIAKNPHDESGERMFTIVGSAEANEKALYLLYSQLEIEKQRRVSAGAVQGGEAGSNGYEHA
ncbi:hypothetical protein NliqN6_4054 [Naganishia liquefaciens]|uniref:K Homology domain-containing protein n=1 Tax=Naganishia liquefaciens TaxID=104408 RepID=A0A8H3TUZ5_9TREE|nr:hypothetical protein NliqN6_4054 [Naganishia liquefaciens]